MSESATAPFCPPTARPTSAALLNQLTTNQRESPLPASLRVQHELNVQQYSYCASRSPIRLESQQSTSQPADFDESQHPPSIYLILLACPSGVSSARR